MTRYLLDTNIISDVFKHPDGRVAENLRGHVADEIGVNLIVIGEILFGLKKRENVRGAERLKALVASLTVWPLEAPVEDVYGAVRATLENKGAGLGSNDMWIAAHALVLDAVLITDDKAFLRVPKLRTENWLRP